MVRNWQSGLTVGLCGDDVFLLLFVEIHYSLDSQVVRLSCPRGEDDLFCISTNEIGNLQRIDKTVISPEVRISQSMPTEAVCTKFQELTISSSWNSQTLHTIL